MEENCGITNNECVTLDFNEILSILISTSLPEQKFDLDECLHPEYNEYVSLCEANLAKLLASLSSLDHSQVGLLPRKIIVNAVLLIGEHSKNNPWTSPQITIYIQQLLKELLVLSACSTILSLLLHLKPDTFLTELRPKLLKSSWKNYPAAVESYVWILYKLECPYLGDVLNSVLPTCLLFVDDHEHKNKVLGLQCLQHVANNVSRTDLNQYGRGEVIYNAIEHMIYSREPEIIPPLGDCLVALLSKTEHNMMTNTLSWSHFDDVLSIWLPSMALEQRIVLREAYISSLNRLLQAMGLSSVRWSKKLLTIFSEYTEPQYTCDKTLECLLSFIDSTWPRIPANFRPIIIILMKVLMKIDETHLTASSSSKTTLDLVKHCFNSLKKHSSADCNRFLNEIKDSSDLKCYYLLLDEGNRIQNC